MDKGLTSPASAAAEIVDAYIIKEESDSRIWDEKPENDMYYLGATMEAYNLISMAVNQFKKK
jgi:phage terminase large subunit-like protein